jgi:hypothetical protein
MNDQPFWRWNQSPLLCQTETTADFAPSKEHPMRNRDVRNDGARVPAGCRWHSIYSETDRADTVDPTPGFTPAEGADKLPQRPGSGNIFSIAYTLTNDGSFRADWTALADNAHYQTNRSLLRLTSVECDRAIISSMSKRHAQLEHCKGGCHV